jgi:hypothetical protein
MQSQTIKELTQRFKNSTLNQSSVNGSVLQDNEHFKQGLNIDFSRHNSGTAINEKDESDLVRYSSDPAMTKKSSSVKVISLLKQESKQKGQQFFQNLDPDLFKVT